MSQEDATIRALAETVKQQGIELDGVIRRCDALHERVRTLQPCPEFPTSELLAGAWSGPARSWIVSQPGPLELTTQMNRQFAVIEEEGGIVESVEMVPRLDVWAACIVYRLPAPEGGETR